MAAASPRALRRFIRVAAGGGTASVPLNILELISGRYTVARGREFADAHALTSEAKAQLDTAEQPLELALLYALSVFKWEDEAKDPGGSFACVVTGFVAALVDRRPAACRRGTPTEAAAMRCLKAVARSPNIDAGGGLDVLLTTLREHTLAIEKNESLKSELRARALGRPPPETTLAFVRAAARGPSGTSSMRRETLCRLRKIARNDLVSPKTSTASP